MTDGKKRGYIDGFRRDRSKEEEICVTILSELCVKPTQRCETVNECEDVGNMHVEILVMRFFFLSAPSKHFHS